MDASKESRTRLIRNLMSVFLAPDVITVSSACGTRKHKALDADIVQACICNSGVDVNICNQSLTVYSILFEPSTLKLQNVLSLSINDKCANYRRKEHK